MRNTLFSLLIALFCASTNADTSTPTRYISSDVAIGILHNAHVVILDGVTDGCWTNIEAVRNRAKAKLEQAGIRTYDERLAFQNGFTARLVISGDGFRAGSVCVGTIRYSVRATVDNRFGDSESTGTVWSVEQDAVMFSKGGIATDGDNLNSVFLSNIDSYTDELISTIYSARRDEDVKNLIDALPNLMDEPMTEERFMEIWREYNE